MRKKLLHIAFVGGGGGVDIAIRLISKHINANNFEQIIISNKITNPYLNSNKEPLRCYVITVNREISIVNDFKSLFRLLKLVKKIKPDIIHCHSAKAGILGRITGQILGIQTFYTPHAFSFLSAQNKFKYYSFLLFEKIIRIFASNSKVIACSSSEKKRAIINVGYTNNEVKVYKNSIKNPKIDLKLRINTSNYACAIGRPSYQKNIEFLIKASAKIVEIIPDFKLLILGVGFHSPNLDKVKSLVKLYKLEKNIQLFEWLERTDTLNILNNARVYLSSSRYEGLPLSGIEAISLGIPSVCTAVDGNIDVVIDNETGYLVRDFDLDDFVAKTIVLMNDEKTQKYFALNAKYFFEKEFNIDNNIKILESIYTSY